jgi:hypothetical protein
MDISGSGFRSFDCLESVARTTAVSLPSAASTCLITTGLPWVCKVLPVLLVAVGTNSILPAFVTFTDAE